jgi:hypothetical protein
MASRNVLFVIIFHVAWSSQSALASQSFEIGKATTARVEAEGLAEGVLRLGGRPTNRSSKARYSAVLSGSRIFATAGGEDYTDGEVPGSHLRSYGVGMNHLNRRTLHRLSMGKFQLSSPWHLLYDLPNSYRYTYVKSNEAAVYEFVRLDGPQAMVAGYREDEIELNGKRSFGGMVKFAWQWPGQEASRVGTSYKFSSKGEYEGLSGIFQNRGFKGQVVSAEFIRQKNLSDIFILSQVVSSLSGFDSKVFFNFSKDRTWQLSFERWSPVWNGLGWNLKLELRKRNPEGFGGALIGGLGGKI